MRRSCWWFIVTLALSATFFSAYSQAETAGNWGHWRGDGNGVSQTAKPPVSWSATKNVKWKIPVPGRGSGSPVVWGDKVFVVSAVRADGERSEQPEVTALEFKLMCFNRGDGKLIWEKTACKETPHEGTHSTNGFASASPCTDGKHVYANFGSRGIYCYSMEGNLVWSKRLGSMRMRAGFGEGSSATIEGDKLLVPWDHEGGSFLTALNKMTGDEIWKTGRGEEPSCWATPLVVEHDGKKQVVVNGQTAARAYDLESGEELWSCGGQTQRPVASPVADGGLVFVGSGHRGSYLGAFKLDGTGDIEGTDHVVWSVDRDTPDIGSPLLSGNRLYYYKGKTGLLTCVNAKTGEPHYETARFKGLDRIYASPVAAAGHVYLTARDGTTVVIKDAEKAEVVATNSVGETVDATPAPVGGELFIRGERHLFCISKMQ